MNYEIKQEEKRTVAGFHLVGPWEQTVARVVGDDFAKPWYQFFNSLLQDSAYEMLPKPCFEVYLNNGAEDGYWDIEMYVAVQPKHH
ncbi:effector binding domain-containing protein [Escherichia coli]|nr:effector binding domain-containing protein [Escherichia coli]